jgi:D-sedoheptulose 7-phosphate isomerase
MKRGFSSSDAAAEVTRALEETVSLHERIAAEHVPAIVRMAGIIIDSYRSGRKLLICGNGGSAADAQHIAGELVGRFLKERTPLNCIALTVDTSVLTAIGNDYGFEEVFARQVRAHGAEGDILLAISTSGNSPNILRAVEEAHRLKMKAVALSGRDGGALSRVADLCVTVPSAACPRIQEAHGTIGHILCALVEKTLFGE